MDEMTRPGPKSESPHAERFKGLAQALLADAEQLHVWMDADRGLCLQTTWRLPVDDTGKTRRSRRLRLIVSTEALEDYAAAKPQDRGAMDRRFERWLRENLVGFTPTPGLPFGQSSPEEWILTARDLSG